MGIQATQRGRRQRRPGTAAVPPTLPPQNFMSGMQVLVRPGINQVKLNEWGLFDFPIVYAQPNRCAVPNLRTATPGGTPSDSHYVFDPQDTYVPKAILDGRVQL
jgi:hypothetical protein